MKMTLIFATKTFLGIFFWAPIAVNSYQIKPGYVPLAVILYKQEVTIRLVHQVFV